MLFLGILRQGRRWAKRKHLWEARQRFPEKRGGTGAADGGPGGAGAAPTLQGRAGPGRGGQGSSPRGTPMLSRAVTPLQLLAVLGSRISILLSFLKFLWNGQKPAREGKYQALVTV